MFILFYHSFDTRKTNKINLSYLLFYFFRRNVVLCCCFLCVFKHWKDRFKWSIRRNFDGPVALNYILSIDVWCIKCLPMTGTPIEDIICPYCIIIMSNSSNKMYVYIILRKFADQRMGLRLIFFLIKDRLKSTIFHRLLYCTYGHVI